MGGGGNMSAAFGGGGKPSDAWLTLACSANGSCDRLSFPGLGGAGGAGGPLPGGGVACCPNLLNRLRRDSWYEDSGLVPEVLCGVGGAFFSGELEFAGGRGGGGGVEGKPSEGGGGKSAGCQRGLVLTAGGGGSGAWGVGN